MGRSRGAHKSNSTKPYKIVLGDLNAQLGKEKKYKEITGPFTAHNRTNKNGEHFIKYCKNFNLKIMSTQFQKPRQKLTTWRSPNIQWGEFQIDHVAITEKKHWRNFEC